MVSLDSEGLTYIKYTKVDLEFLLKKTCNLDETVSLILFVF